jgi:DNA-binding NtrC family response regulator
MNTPYRLIGSSAAMQEIQQELECAARSDATVLITGEPGVGKEVVARLIHQQGRRRDKPFVAINCAGVPDTLLETELFGNVRDSSDNAHHVGGLFERAHGGTVYLDEIGEMSVRLQAALLRFLENGDVQRVGGDGVYSTVDVRILASTSRNLHVELFDEQFRADLYYRLNVIHIVIPPLRERKGDLSLLLSEFMRQSSEAHRLEVPTLLTETRHALLAYSWPGNLRELKSVADRMVIGVRSGVVRPSDLPSEIINNGRQPGPPSSAQQVGISSTADRIYERMTVDRESFWSVAYEPFMARTLSRRDLRILLMRGLQQTRGNYKSLAQLFNVDEADCKRFLSLLRKHEYRVALQKVRSVPARSKRLNDRLRASLQKTG